MGDTKKTNRKGGTLPKGTLLKQQYQIEKVLGRGGFGITYRATDINLQVQVAVKEFLSDNGVQRERTMREARIAASLYDLEAIVTVRDYFIENDIAYIVMEYVHGISVKDFVMQHGRMDGREVLREMQPLFVSLQKIHDKGILHRDISVDNLLITKEGKLKLIDFGAASKWQGNDREEHTVLIKRGFAAIEQYRAEEPLGTWTDVYSLCATMYFMITGIVPQDAMERWIDDKLTDLADIYGTGLTDSQAKAIMHGMEVTGEKRYQTITELQKAVYECVGEKERKLWQDTEQILPSMIQSKSHTRTLRKEAKKLLEAPTGNKKKTIGILIGLALIVGGAYALVSGWSAKNGVTPPSQTSTANATSPTNEQIPQADHLQTNTPSEDPQPTQEQNQSTAKPTAKPTKRPAATAKATKRPAATRRPKATAKPTRKPTPTPHRSVKTAKPKTTQKSSGAKSKDSFDGNLDSLLDD